MIGFNSLYEKVKKKNQTLMYLLILIFLVYSKFTLNLIIYMYKLTEHNNEWLLFYSENQPNLISL